MYGIIAHHIIAPPPYVWDYRPPYVWDYRPPYVWDYRPPYVWDYSPPYVWCGRVNIKCGQKKKKKDDQGRVKKKSRKKEKKCVCGPCKKEGKKKKLTCFCLRKQYNALKCRGWRRQGPYGGVSERGPPPYQLVKKDKSFLKKSESNALK
jgi:hypothetical protein